MILQPETDDELRLIEGLRKLSEEEQDALFLAVTKHRIEGGDFEAMLAEWRADVNRKRTAAA